MKRTVLSLILVAIIFSVGFAEENLSGEKTFANGNYRFVSGGFWTCGQDFCGGFELQYSTNTAFVIEFGGINRLLLGKNKNDFEGYAKTNPVLTIGFRTLK